jgi:hypothetical protein
MSDQKPVKSAQQIAVPLDAYDKAKRMANALAARGEDTNQGKVTGQAILEYYDRLPIEVREFIESQNEESDPQTTPQTVAPA